MNSSLGEVDPLNVDSIKPDLVAMDLLYGLGTCVVRKWGGGD
jgi:hypothetical protein